MARFVHEIMNHELFFLRPSDTVGNAILGILSLGVSAAPVVDGERRPVGVVSLRDLIGSANGDTVGERMSSPALTVSQDAPIAVAGRALAERGLHRVIAIDDDGHAVGVVSSVDLVRALLDIPPRHPAAFPHLDASGLSWSDPVELDLDHASAAPDGPGIFVLLHDEKERPALPVWAESSPNVRTRIHQLIGMPQGDHPWLARVLEKSGRHLRFRAASVEDGKARAEALQRAQENVAAAVGLPSP